jgi:hypothetical protein
MVNVEDENAHYPDLIITLHSCIEISHKYVQLLHASYKSDLSLEGRGGGEGRGRREEVYKQCIYM